MKKLAIFLTIFLCGCVVFADETRPEQSFNDNRAVISVQKQPAAEQAQKQGIKNNWFCIVIQVNGKSALDSAVPAAKP